MADNFRNKVGIADYGMNVWYGAMYDYETRMEQIKAIGYDGLERVQPLDATDLVNKMVILAKHNMDFATVELDRPEQNIQWTAAMGRKYVWISSPNSRDHFDEFCRRANYLAEACAKYSIRCGLHNHLGSPVETQEELEIFLERCPEVGMVYDVGHLAVAGGNVVEIAEKYADRILAVHLKEWCYTTDDRSVEWYDQGYFTGLGQGTFPVDNEGVVKTLLKHGYQGWFFIEEDTHKQEPLIDLDNSRKILRSWGV